MFVPASHNTQLRGVAFCLHLEGGANCFAPVHNAARSIVCFDDFFRRVVGVRNSRIERPNSLDAFEFVPDIGPASHSERDLAPLVRFAESDLDDRGFLPSHFGSGLLAVDQRPNPRSGANDASHSTDKRGDIPNVHSFPLYRGLIQARDRDSGKGAAA